MIKFLKELFTYSEDKNTFVVRTWIDVYCVDNLVEEVKARHIESLRYVWCHKFEHKKLVLSETTNAYILTTVGVR